MSLYDIPEWDYGVGRAERHGESEMTESVTTHHADDPADEVAATFHRDGAVIVANLASAKTMDALTADLPFNDRTKVGNEFIGGSDNRSVGAVLHAKPEICETLLLTERVLEVADRILRPEEPMAASSKPNPRPKPRFKKSDDGCVQIMSTVAPPEEGPYCHHYRVGASVSLQARSGGAVQVLHREMSIYEPFVEHSPTTRDLIFNVMWAGTDFTAENGATRVVPGSHRWPAERIANESEVAQAVMPKGSVLFWHCRALHGLAASRSDARRTGIFHSFVVDWLAQEENQYIGFPAEDAARLSVRARQILGYRAGPTCGWVKGRDSKDLLADGASGPLELKKRSRTVDAVA